MDAKSKQTAFVYTTYVQETPGRVWQGLTDPALIKRYWRHTRPVRPMYLRRCPAAVAGLLVVDEADRLKITVPERPWDHCDRSHKRAGCRADGRDVAVDVAVMVPA
jgi:hypothetical protein